jgi:hypothetical protein
MQRFLKRKSMLFVVTPLAMASAIAILLPDLKLKQVAGAGNNTNYTMSFSSSHNAFPTSSTETTASPTTDENHPISFTYSGLVASSTYWGLLQEGGYFFNSDPIHGLQSISITFASASSIKLSYGWSVTTYRVSDTILSSNESNTLTYEFANEGPSYFKIGYNTAESSIVSLSLTYSCVGTSDPYNAGTEGLTMSLSSDETHYIVSGYTGSATEVTINSTYRNKPVTEIGTNAFASNYKITQVNLPSSISKMGSSAFKSCIALTTINIPTGITTISDNCFYTCSALSSITIPSTVTLIGQYAFYGCSKLTQIVLPSSVQNIASYAFESESNLASIYIPSSVTTMGSSVFYGDSKLSISCEATEKPTGWSSNWSSGIKDTSISWGVVRP